MGYHSEKPKIIPLRKFYLQTHNSYAFCGKGAIIIELYLIG